jgi:hypothetical protein
LAGRDAGHLLRCTVSAGLRAFGLIALAIVIAGCARPATLTTAAHAAVLPTPDVPQPQGANDVVGFNIQNTNSAAQRRRFVSFGQPFTPGKVPATASLVAQIGSQKIPVQMDVKTRYPDGSARFAVLTLRAPQLGAMATVRGMLALGNSTGPAVDLAKALDKYNLTATLAGSMSKTINIAKELRKALASGQASYWLRGPSATQARVDVPIAGSLHAVFDVTAYADDTFATDAMFNNDYAMQPAGGTVVYAVTFKKSGRLLYTPGPLIHYQYQQWRKLFYSASETTINIQHDSSFIMKTGVVQNYDTITGIDSAGIPTAAYKPLADAGLTRYMPTTGDRDDIGPMTHANALWLLSQDATAAKAGRARADAAASVPWHYWDPKRGDYVSLDDYPTLWADPRGNPKLTQDGREPTWTPDTAHQPGLSLVPYLLTGERFYLDQINAQATFAELATWHVPRRGGLGIVLNDSDQVRAQAWNLRQVDDAAWANPDGSKAKTYWQRILKNNYDFMLNTIAPAYDAAAGELAGYVYGAYRGDGADRPQLGAFMQDFVVSSVATSASRGSAEARKMLQWMADFQVGRFHHGLASAVGYVVHLGDSPGSLYKTWAEYVRANGTSDDLPQDGGYWVPLGLATLASIYNVLGLQDALDAYKLVSSKSAPGTDIASFRGPYAKFHVVPLSDTSMRRSSAR